MSRISDEEFMANFRQLSLRGDDDGPPAPPMEAYRDEATRPGATVAQFRELTVEEIAQIQPAPFRAWAEKDLAKIPYPEQLYGDHYARGYTSVTAATPKMGKSLLGLAEAVDMATGRGFLTGRPRDPLRVVYYNAEDDQNVIDSRVAAILTHFGIPQSEIVGRLFPTSGVDGEDLFLISGQEGVINERAFISLEKFCEQERADVLSFDPLQDLSRSPETNEVFRVLGLRLRRLAAKMRIAVGLTHHTRKLAPGVRASIDDMRGGGALRGAARFNRVLVPMTKDEGAKADVEDHRNFFRVGHAESNLAPPSADMNLWFQKISVLTPNGRHVGAVARWSRPEAFVGVSIEVSSEVASAARRAVMASEKALKWSSQANDWVGHVVGEVLGINTTEESGKTRVKAIVKAWIESGLLCVERRPDTRNGRPAPFVLAGDKDPAEVDG